jgi:hypothetical protein
LLKRLGGSAIPFYAIFPANDPQRPIVFDGLVTKGQVLKYLDEAMRQNAELSSVAMSDG